MIRIISFQSLLKTDRAVKQTGVHVRIHLAGRLSEPYWVEFFKASDAKKAAGSLVVHLREKVARGQITSNTDYNATIHNWVDQLANNGYIKEKGKDAEEPETEETVG